MPICTGPESSIFSCYNQYAITLRTISLRSDFRDVARRFIRLLPYAQVNTFSIWYTHRRHHHHQWTAFPQSGLKSTEVETATMMLDLDEYDPLPTTTCTVPADAQSRPGFDTQNQN